MRAGIHCAGSLHTLWLFSQHACVPSATLTEDALCLLLPAEQSREGVPDGLTVIQHVALGPPALTPFVPIYKASRATRVADRLASCCCSLLADSFVCRAQRRTIPCFKPLLLLPRLGTIFILARSYCACRACNLMTTRRS